MQSLELGADWLGSLCFSSRRNVLLATLLLSSKILLDELCRGYGQLVRWGSEHLAWLTVISVGFSTARVVSRAVEEVNYYHSLTLSFHEIP